MTGSAETKSPITGAVIVNQIYVQPSYNIKKQNNSYKKATKTTKLNVMKLRLCLGAFYASYHEMDLTYSIAQGPTRVYNSTSGHVTDVQLLEMRYVSKKATDWKGIP